MASLLIVDDRKTNLDVLKHLLSKQNKHTILTAVSASAALKLMERQPVDVVITDLIMESADAGIVLLSKIKRLYPATEVIVITGLDDDRLAEQAKKEGAYEFLLISYDLPKLPFTVENALKKRLLEKKYIAECLDPIVGKSKALQELKSRILKYAPRDCTILISGETGVGKQLFSETIHKLSKRSDGPFQEVYCPALPNELIEYELFGILPNCVPQVKERTGMFECAQGGTIFLDQIESASLSAQSKILKAIEEKRIKRIGDNQWKNIDVRIIAATNEDLETLCERKLFRQDLYHRLKGVTLSIPPLRERKEDIELLANHFLRIHNRNEATHVKSLSNEAIDFLVQQDWRGNVRDLRNEMWPAVINCEGDELSIKDFTALKSKPSNGESALAKEIGAHAETLHEWNALIIEIVLSKHSGSIIKTCTELDINRGVLYSLIKKYNIDLKRIRARK